ncbi:MAG: hydrogenase [Gammaproteobacteria bacterium]|nr:hydrogenase [Gammaproteobacteria bacterium]
MNEQTSRKLIAAGAVLFLLGLVTGFVIPIFENSRMGLASHLEGVMNGTFLIAVGAVWSRLILSARLQATAFWLLLYGTYANWLLVLLAAMYGTSEMTPIAGAGHSGLPWQETLVTVGLSSVGITMLAAVTILVIGFMRHQEGS